MAKQTKKQRADHYEPKIKLKDGVEFVDVLNASLGLVKKKDKPKAKIKKNL